MYRVREGLEEKQCKINPRLYYHIVHYIVQKKEQLNLILILVLKKTDKHEYALFSLLNRFFPASVTNFRWSSGEWSSRFCTVFHCSFSFFSSSEAFEDFWSCFGVVSSDLRWWFLASSGWEWSNDSTTFRTIALDFSSSSEFWRLLELIQGGFIGSSACFRWVSSSPAVLSTYLAFPVDSPFKVSFVAPLRCF